MHPVGTARAKYAVCAGAFPTNTTRMTASVFQDVEVWATNHDLSFTHIDPEAFLFKVQLPGSQLFFKQFRSFGCL